MYGNILFEFDSLFISIQQQTYKTEATLNWELGPQIEAALLHIFWSVEVEVISQLCNRYITSTSGTKLNWVDLWCLNVNIMFFFMPVWHFVDVTTFFHPLGSVHFCLPWWRDLLDDVGEEKATRNLLKLNVFGSENRNVLVDRKGKDVLCIFFKFLMAKFWQETIFKNSVDWSWYMDIDLSNWKHPVCSVMQGGEILYVVIWRL